MLIISLIYLKHSQEVPTVVGNVPSAQCKVLCYVENDHHLCLNNQMTLVDINYDGPRFINITVPTQRTSNLIAR